MSEAGATPDAVPRSFVEHLPQAARPYARLARLDRPIGWWLLLLPCWWSEALAALGRGAWPSPLTLLLFLIGAVAMRGAGSTWNDITDRDLDRQVERTRNRPLASGAIGLKAAFAFLAMQAGIGLAVLLSFPPFAVLAGLASLVPVAIYPFMKRITSHPQIVLGLAFAWGALMGFAVQGSLPPAAWALYAGAIAWVIGYDTIYALQDLEDDAIVGIGSTARAYGARVRLFVAIMYGLAVLGIAVAMAWSGSGWAAWLGLGAFAGHLGWQVARIDRDDPVRALALFRANRTAGLILFAGLMLDAGLRASGVLAG